MIIRIGNLKEHVVGTEDSNLRYVRLGWNVNRHSQDTDHDFTAREQHFGMKVDFINNRHGKQL